MADKFVMPKDLQELLKEHNVLDELEQEEYPLDEDEEEMEEMDVPIIYLPMPLHKINMTMAELAESHVLCQDSHVDGNFVLLDGAHYIYTAENDELKLVGYNKIPAACKNYSPSLGQIQTLGARLAKDYKYDKPFTFAPCCQSKQIESPYCVAQNNHEECMGYEPEEWTTRRTAKTESNDQLVLESGRLYSGVPYLRITLRDEILFATAGKDLEDIDTKTTVFTLYDNLLVEHNATEETLPPPGPKNPYLESLLV